MHISHKSNVLQTVHETEWQCRRLVKGLNKSEYWTWLATVTSGDPPVADYSGETGYTIVECTDEDVQARLSELGDYQSSSLATGTVYNIKYYASKRDAEEILDNDGNSQDPKVYVQSHFVGQDDTKDARILADKWANVRRQRDRLLTESDWVVIKAKEEHINTSIDSNWIDYRTALRDITKQSDPDNITWPTKP
jgi:hypothetical protein